MKVLCIGDVHGKEECWKPFVDEYFDEVDKIVFTGDYLDEWVLPNQIIKQNFINIINFKKNNFDKVELLYGNHEFSYIDDEYICSGYRAEIALDLRDLLHQYKDYFKHAYQIGNVIFTHAGIQHNWFVNEFKGDLNLNIANQLNNPQNRNQLYALHHVGHRRGGYNDVGGIFWCDKNELTKPLQNFTQVVGHTPVKYIHHWKADNKFKKSEIYFIDCMDKIDKPLILQINE